jgi:hypothetical protein
MNMVMNVQIKSREFVDHLSVYLHMPWSSLLKAFFCILTWGWSSGVIINFKI